VAMFVHGCFWHRHSGCHNAKLPSTRQEFWHAKLEGNAARDRQAVASLLAAGWRVLTVWECATRDTEALASLSEMVSRWIESAEPVGEISAAQPA
jgi:DNA mismatch endonuclease (patch repair protein)